MILLLTLIFEKISKIFPARCAFGLNSQRQINLSHIAMAMSEIVYLNKFCNPCVTSGIDIGQKFRGVQALQQLDIKT